MKHIPTYIKTALLLLALFVMQACGGGGGSKDTSVDKRSTSLSVIRDYAENGNIAPTIQDYTDAGIKGIKTPAQLAEINEVIERLKGEDVDTFEEIQALVNTSVGTDNNDKAFQITHHGITYGIITSPLTKRVWLDRNLGQKNICTRARDKKCLGWKYQWGRAHDGHHLRRETVYDSSSDIESELTRSGVVIIPYLGVDDWILGPDDEEGKEKFDWYGKKREAIWSKTDGSSICPKGFRVPSLEELLAELIPKGTEQSNKMFNEDETLSFLRLGASGMYKGGGKYYDTQYGWLWSSTPHEWGRASMAVRWFPNLSVNSEIEDRVTALEVRCIQE